MIDERIVCGIIQNNEKILIGRKIERKHPAGFEGEWTIPGGRIKKGETPDEAIVREIKEETNLDVKVERLESSKDFVKNVGMVEVFYFECTPKNLNYNASDDLQELKFVNKKTFLDFIGPNFKQLLSKKVVEKIISQ